MARSVPPGCFATIEEAIAEVRAGRMVVVVDDEARENEGDLVLAASKVTPEAIAFMVRHCSGIVCVPLEAERLRELELPLMAPDASDPMGTAFTVSVDARRGTTTGISAQDRAVTIATLIDPRARPGDLARPGHVFPLRYTPGGVLRRPGHTEAAVDLARLAGLEPAGVLCEIVNDDGSVARLDGLHRFARRHGLKLVSIADLIAYRRRREPVVARVAEASLATAYGQLGARAYGSLDGRTHVALVKGDPRGRDDVLVRVHPECFAGDVLGSLACDCGARLRAALERVASSTCGVLVYVRGRAGRVVGRGHEVEAHALRDAGVDTVGAEDHLGPSLDAREDGVAVAILDDLGVAGARLLTNDPGEQRSLEDHGLRVTERVPLRSAPPESARYLEAKRDELGHVLELVATEIEAASRAEEEV